MSGENEVVECVEVEGGVKMPKNSKENRYYYRHREEIIARRRAKRLEDPEYQAKLREKEEKKKRKEEEAKRQKEERSRERAKKKAELLGVLASPPGASKNQ